MLMRSSKPFLIFRPNELTDLRRWFDDGHVELWDQQIEDDVAVGKIDALADATLVAARNGQATDL